MARLLREDRGFSNAFVGHLVQHIVSAEETLVDHLFNSSEKRLARILLLLAHFDQKGQPGTLVVPKVTHEVLAQMVGTTRARIHLFHDQVPQDGICGLPGWFARPRVAFQFGTPRLNSCSNVQCRTDLRYPRFYKGEALLEAWWSNAMSSAQRKERCPCVP